MIRSLIDCLKPFRKLRGAHGDRARSKVGQRTAGCSEHNDPEGHRRPQRGVREYQAVCGADGGYGNGSRIAIRPAG